MIADLSLDSFQEFPLHCLHCCLFLPPSLDTKRDRLDLTYLMERTSTRKRGLRCGRPHLEGPIRVNVMSYGKKGHAAHARNASGLNSIIEVSGDTHVTMVIS
jgi:hypothetical protein